LSPARAERLLSWRHTGFTVHSRVWAKTKPEAEGKVSYRYGQDRFEQETMDYLEFIARVTSHIPDKGQVMVRDYGLYANAHGGRWGKRASPLWFRG